jgi:hypothetical protein
MYPVSSNHPDCHIDTGENGVTEGSGEAEDATTPKDPPPIESAEWALVLSKIRSGNCSPGGARVEVGVDFESSGGTRARWGMEIVGTSTCQASTRAGRQKNRSTVAAARCGP